MIQKRKQICSILLVMCMLICMLPVTAYAEMGNTEIIEPVELMMGTATTRAAITVGKQLGVLVEGVKSDDVGMFSNVRYRLETENIEDGEYIATVNNLPEGVSLKENFVYISFEGKGTLALQGDNSTQPGTTNLTLTITGEGLPDEGITSDPFDLIIVDSGYLDIILNNVIKILEIETPFEITKSLIRYEAYVEGKGISDLEAATVDEQIAYEKEKLKYEKFIEDVSEDFLNNYLEDPDELIERYDEVLADYKVACDALAAAAKPFFKNEAWEYARLHEELDILFVKLDFAASIGKISEDDYDNIVEDYFFETKKIEIKYFGSYDDAYDAVINEEWELLVMMYTDVYNYLHGVLIEYGIEEGGNNGGGSSGGGSSGGSSSGGGSSGGSKPEPTLETEQGKPVKSVVTVNADNDGKGLAKAVVSPETITEAIKKAQNKVKAGSEEGISVKLNVEMPKGTTALTVNLEKSSLDGLVEAGVSVLEIGGGPVQLNINLNALKEIQKQSGGNISVSINPVTELSPEAQAVIGNRPVYNIIISTVRNNEENSITNLGNETTSILIPYTPSENEFTEYLYGVYVDEEGNVINISGSKYDAEEGMLIIPTEHFSVYGVGYTNPSAKFTDIDNHWGKEFIDYVVGYGLLKGTSDSTFSPDIAMTRGMLVTALGRLAGADVNSYNTNSFVDVNDESAFRPYIEWAYNNGIIKGIGNNNFAPGRNITREEIAIIFANYMKADNVLLPYGGNTTYVDNDEIGIVYKEAVAAMQQVGIVKGDENNMFNPQKGATRAEVSTMLYRYIEVIK